MRHDIPMPPSAKRKPDSTKNPEDIDEIVMHQKEVDRNTYVVRVNKTTIVLRPKKK